MRPARARRVALACAVAAIVLGACGIPLDRAPRDVADDSGVGVSGASAPSGATAASGGPRIYFVAADVQGAVPRLQQVSRAVPPTPNDVLAALFGGLTNDERTRLTTQIPPGTKLNSVQPLGDGTVVIDVDETFFQAKNVNQIIALAQIVYTATALPAIERVRLLVDGASRPWTGGDGRQRNGDLTPLAYPAFYPADQPDLPPVPSPPGPTTTTLPPTTVPAPTSTNTPPRAGVTSPPPPPAAATTTLVTEAPPEEAPTTSADP